MTKGGTGWCHRIREALFCCSNRRDRAVVQQRRNSHACHGPPGNVKLRARPLCLQARTYIPLIHPPQCAARNGREHDGRNWIIAGGRKPNVDDRSKVYAEYASIAPKQASSYASLRAERDMAGDIIPPENRKCQKMDSEKVNVLYWLRRFDNQVSETGLPTS